MTAHRTVLVVGPTGVGKTFVACALAHAALRHDQRALYLRVPRLLDELVLARADGRLPRLMAAWARLDVLILDDFGLRKLTAQQSSDFYDVLVERDKRAATVITSNRAVDEWVALFDDPILANSALDRVAHRAHQIVMDGPSLRAVRAPNGPRRRGDVAR